MANSNAATHFAFGAAPAARNIFTSGAEFKA
jgi:hypothetical protein